MTQGHSFVIRRSFVLPVGLLLLLTVALLVTCVAQGQPLAKIILLVFIIIPLAVIFVESAFRRVVISPNEVIAYRPFRQRQLLFVEVTSLETVQVRSRVFMTLAAGDDDFLIISNSYGNFPALVDLLVAAVPEGTVTEETQLMAKRPPYRLADTFTVWFAVIALIYVLIAQFKT